MSIDGRERSLLVRVQGQLCAMPLASVEEAMPPQPIRALADAPAFVRVIEQARLSEMPPLVARAGGEVVSIGTLDAELLMVLRASRLVPDDVWAAIEAAATSDGGDAA